MKTFLKQIWKLVTPKDRVLIGLFLVLMILASLMEIFSFFSIIPFIGVLSDPSQIQSNRLYSFLFETFQFQDNKSFFVFIGALSAGFITLSSLFLAFFQWFNFRFLFRLGSTLTVSLYRIYLSQNYSFFLNRNSSGLTKNLFVEMGRFIQAVILPMSTIISRSLVVVILAGIIFVSDPTLAVIITGSLGITYFFIFSFFRKKLDSSAKEGFKYRDAAFRLGNETFWTVKELKLYGLEKAFEEEFQQTYYKSFKPDADHSTASALPRYLIEMITFSGIIFILLYLLSSTNDFAKSIPILSLYAFSAYKMLPYLQQIYQSTISIRFSKPSMDALSKDVGLAPGPILPAVRPDERINLNHSIELKSVTFSYPLSEKKILDRVDLIIKSRSLMGFVGKTGEGKTTLVDIILGLLRPQEGELLVDGQKIDETNAGRWSASVGYVPQQIVLWDDTIARNIAFSAPGQEIDMERVRKSAEAANLLSFVENELPDKFLTNVGERGVKLSGGQRQRIGIARALYRDPEILVLDEATSALDNETEKAVMEAIDSLGGKKTILMIAHRLSTLEKCDHIVRVSKGHLIKEK